MKNDSKRVLVGKNLFLPAKKQIKRFTKLLGEMVYLCSKDWYRYFSQFDVKNSRVNKQFIMKV